MINWQALTTTIVAGVLTLALVIATVTMAAIGKNIPEEFTSLLQVGFGVAVGGAAAARR